ncbi:hypothetical protein ACFLSQ_07855 [Bacteroidota bacterium]
MKYVIYTITILLMFSCNQNKQDFKSPSHEVILKKTVQTFEDNNIIETEIIDYQYERPNDPFWIEAIYKDSSGEIFKTIKRQLDIKTRLPIREFVFELGEVSESYKVIYSSNNHKLIYKEEYEGEIKTENKIRSTKWQYKMDFLTSQTINVFSRIQGFINLDGTNISDTYKLRYLPANNSIPKGNFEIYYFIEFRKKYDTDSTGKTFGQIILEEKTKFDDNGSPVYHYASELDCAHAANEEWYLPKINSNGKLILLTGFADKYHKSVNSLNSQFHFEYNSNGYIERIAEYKYNPLTNDYSNFHDMQFFDWIVPEMQERENISNYNYQKEHYCFTGKRHSIFKIETKYITPQKKIVEEYFDAYSGKYKSQDLKPELSTRTTFIY